MKRFLSLMLIFTALSCSGRGREILTIGISEGIISRDPHIQDEIVTMEVLGNVYESLVAFDVDMQLMPMLCTGYANVNDRTWRFYIRPGVTFHDGRTMSAEDAIYSLERARDNESSVFKSMLSVINRVQKIDSLTIEVSTVKPRPNLINTLTLINIIPAGSDPAVRPIGTGPYFFRESSETNAVKLERYELYWSKKPYFQKVNFTVVKNDSLREAKLLNGEIDIDANVLESYRTGLSDNPKVVMITRPGSTITLLGMNVKGGKNGNPLSDVRIRQAVSLAIDRREMVDSACHGHAVPANQLATQFVFGFNPDIKEMVRDTTEAARLVEEAGAGSTIELNLKTSTVAWVEGQMIAKYLRSAGIRLKVDTIPWRELYNSIERGEAGFYLMGFGYSYADVSEILNDMIHTKGSNRDFGIRALSGYSNRSLDSIIEKADTQFDPAVRKHLLQKAMAIVSRDLPFIPLYIRDSSYGIRDGLRWDQKTASVMLAKEISPEI